MIWSGLLLRQGSWVLSVFASCHSRYSGGTERKPGVHTLGLRGGVRPTEDIQGRAAAHVSFTEPELESELGLSL